MSRSGSGLSSLQAWFEKRQSERPAEALESLRAQVSKLKITNYKNLLQILEREAYTAEHEAEALRVMLRGGSFTEAKKAAQGLPYKKPGELMSGWAWFARTALNVLGFAVSLALLPVLVAVRSVVLYTVLYATIYVAPFICLGRYVYRRLSR